MRTRRLKNREGVVTHTLSGPTVYLQGRVPEETRSAYAEAAERSGMSTNLYLAVLAEKLAEENDGALPELHLDETRSTVEEHMVTAA